MSYEKIISEWEKKVFKPVYWLEGEEEFFINKVMDYAEHHILNEAESGFNLSVFYGKDADWTQVVNACMRYPMLATRQVVLLKEGQQMRDIEKLESYIVKPLTSTVFVVSYKDKKLDGRTKFAKMVKEKGVLLSTKKLYDNQLPQWVEDIVHQKGLEISRKATMLIVDHIGNDLSRIENEIDKLSVNLGKRKNITEDDIETYIGISKEFNVFEFQQAVAEKNLNRCLQIISYFEANPKAAPVQLVLPSLYSFFSKIFMIHGLSARDDKSVSAALGVNPFFVKDYQSAATRYTYPETEKVILLLHQYNLRAIGVNDAGTNHGSLLKEMVFKIISSN